MKPMTKEREAEHRAACKSGISWSNAQWQSRLLETLDAVSYFRAQAARAEKAIPMNPTETMIAAGRRAAQWYIDTGDCFFCCVDSAEKGRFHEEHCTFYGVPDSALKEILSEP
jgi:hypothetical protein